MYKRNASNNSNDDGTWRRIRKIEFKSKFTEKPYDDPRFLQKEYPHQFKVDSKIDEKFKIWRLDVIFIS